MIGRFPTTEEAALAQARATARWLEQGGQTYTEDTVEIVAFHMAGIHVRSDKSGDQFLLNSDNVSVGSWYVLEMAEIGHSVLILMRTDKVGRCPTLEKA